MGYTKFQKYPKSILLISLLVTASIIILIYPRPLPVPSFEWNVQVGDTFTFSVTAHLSGNYSELNNTLVTVQVTSLPNLSNDWNESEFITEVVESMKTSLIHPVVHENGTEIISQFSDSINNILSQCILPVGGWNALDYFYPDESDPADYSFYCNTYFSYFEDNLFTFGHVYFFIDGGFGWDGQIEEHTGVPIGVRIWKIGLVWPPGFYDMTLQLQPIETA